MKRGPLKVFYSYAHEDESMRDRIEEHLELLKRQQLIIGWYDRHIIPGTAWNKVIGEQLLEADIVLLLISRAFLDSDYVRRVEIPEAMKAYESGQVRVIPILLEETPGWEKEPFAQLQILPSEARPILEWEDPVHALRDVARGIRRVARDVIIAGGGPFEFGPHEFSEAELSMLDKIERAQTAAGLQRLRQALHEQIPPRRYEANLLLATWSLRKFGDRNRLPDPGAEALFYLAQIISSYDLVALQEVDQDLDRFHKLLEILGPDWDSLLTDVAPGAWGNRERFAIVYYKPRVEFRNFSSQVILPPKRTGPGEYTPAVQLARPPLIAAFRSGPLEFQVVTTHIIFGGGNDARSVQRRLEEIEKLGEYLQARSRYAQNPLFLMGDFQVESPDSPLLQALRDSGVHIPDHLLLPSNLDQTKYYSQIGFVDPDGHPSYSFGEKCAGAVDFFRYVYRSEDRDTYITSTSFKEYSRQPYFKGKVGTKKEQERRYWFWKTYLMSDHLPLWVELELPEEESGKRTG